MSNILFCLTILAAGITAKTFSTCGDACDFTNQELRDECAELCVQYRDDGLSTFKPFHTCASRDPSCDSEGKAPNIPAFGKCVKDRVAFYVEYGPRSMWEYFKATAYYYLSGYRVYDTVVGVFSSVHQFAISSLLRPAHFLSGSPVSMNCTQALYPIFGVAFHSYTSMSLNPFSTALYMGPGRCSGPAVVIGSESAPVVVARATSIVVGGTVTHGWPVSVYQGVHSKSITRGILLSPDYIPVANAFVIRRIMFSAAHVFTASPGKRLSYAGLIFNSADPLVPNLPDFNDCGRDIAASDCSCVPRQVGVLDSVCTLIGYYGNSEASAPKVSLNTPLGQTHPVTGYSDAVIQRGTSGSLCIGEHGLYIISAVSMLGIELSYLMPVSML